MSRLFHHCITEFLHFTLSHMVIPTARHKVSRNIIYLSKDARSTWGWMFVGSTLCWCKANHPCSIPVGQAVVIKELLLGIGLKWLGNPSPPVHPNGHLHKEFEEKREVALSIPPIYFFKTYFIYNRFLSNAT